MPVRLYFVFEMTVSFIEACFLCQEYSMGLKLTTRDPENFGFADSRLLPVARQVRCSHSLSIG
jgi:hypothetical protein